MAFRVVVGLMLLMAAGCVRAPLRDRSQAMRPMEAAVELVDDLQFQDLASGLKANISRLNERPEEVMHFGQVQVSSHNYARVLEQLLQKLEADPTGEAFKRLLKSEFQVLEIYGKKTWGEVFVTSYFEPEISGSRKKTKKHSQALYGKPKDMVVIRMDQFSKRLPQFADYADRVLEQKSRASVVRARIIKPEKEDENSFPQVVPYFDREEIDMQDALKQNVPIIAWVDPIDSFFLQIQGSGVVKFADGKNLRVGYAAQNGHPYVAIGAHLLDVIPREEMSLQKIESHLRSLPAEEAMKILNLNPSYVFFRKLKNGGVTYFGTDVVPGRTVATDHDFFPKGALGFLQFEKPVFEGKAEPKEWSRTSRFVLDQDTGGAIRGGHRLDLFWGRGAVAKQFAGVMKNWGKMFYFVPKPEFLQQVNSNRISITQ